MQNINYVGGAGSTTAAQFCKGFINKTPWHLTLQMAFSNMYVKFRWSNRFGVRLLNELIEENYE